MKPTKQLTLITFLLFMSRGMVGPISSIFWRDLGASYLVIGVLSTVTSLVSIIASPLWGRAMDRYQKRKGFLITGLILLGISTGLVVLVPGYGWLFPLYIVMSTGQAAYSTSSLALMGDWLEYDARQLERTSGPQRNSGRKMGTYRGLASLGFGLMAFTAGTVVDNFSLRAPFILSAAFLAAAVLLSIRVQEAPVKTDENLEKTEEAPNSDAENKTPLPLLPLLVAALLWSLVTGAVYAVWANYMVEEIGFSPSQMTRLWSVASLSEFPLMIVAGWLSDRIGRLPMMSLGFVAWTIVFIGYMVVPTMPWIIAVQLIRGFAYPIQISERQACWLRVTFKGQGGHGSIPVKNGAMAKVGRFLTLLDKNQLPIHVTTPSRLMLDAFASSLGGIKGRVLGQLLNPALSNLVLNLLGEQAKLFRPLLHNTVSATGLKGSQQVNVIPGEVIVDLDGRLLPGFKPENLIDELKTLADGLGDDIHFEVLDFQVGPSEPDMGLFDLLKSILVEKDPRGIPVPMVLPGVTDARLMSRLGIQTYGFLPMQLPDDFKIAERLHGVDERIPVQAMAFGSTAMVELLKRFGDAE